jgi:ATP-binding cassette subfamily B protein
MAELPIFPTARLEEALERLGGVGASPVTLGPVAADAGAAELQRWLYAAAAGRGLEVEPLRAYGGELESALRTSAPALVAIHVGHLAVVRVRRRRVTLLVPDGGKRDVDLDDVCAALRALWEHRYRLRSIDGPLREARLTARRRARAADAFVRCQLELRRIEVGWSVRIAASSSVVRQLARTGFTATLAKVVGALFLVPTATVLAWALLGRGLLDGTLDRGWLVAWGIALATVSAARVLSGFWQDSAAIALGAIIKKRLLLGALRIEPNATKREGLGLTMGRVLESNSVEDLSLAGGFLGVSGFVELLAALVVLFGVRVSVGAVFAGFVAVVALIAALYYRRMKRWTFTRVPLTHALIERLVGARTRSVQESPENWHHDEDRLLSAYADESRGYDRFTTLTDVVMRRGALLIGIATLTPLFVAGAAPATLWIGLGGVLLAQQAMVRLATGLPPLVGALVAWRSARPLFAAARRCEDRPTAAGLAGAMREVTVGASLLRAHNVQFGFDPHRQPVLRELALEVRVGDRVLVEGGSGSGKSTLASLIAGIHSPQAGLMMLSGLDRGTLGAAGWRKRVAAAPQYHENYIFQGPLAFNLLLGREWPPSVEDLAEAEAVCRELGFGPLLARMPSGIMQPVGPAGWRLSHGEQSRIFIARALLQRGELVVLDESFAALDPETLQLTMRCVERRARTLMLVAHP